MPDLSLHHEDGDGDARALRGRDADEPLVAPVGVLAVQAPGLAGDAHARDSERPPAAGRRGARCRARSSRPSCRASAAASAEVSDATRRARAAGSGSSRPLPSTTRVDPARLARAGRPPPCRRGATAWSGVMRQPGEPAAELAERVRVLAPGPRRGRRACAGAGASRRPKRRITSSSRRRRASCTASCAKHWLFEVASALRERDLGPAPRRVHPGRREDVGAAVEAAGRGAAPGVRGRAPRPQSPP